MSVFVRPIHLHRSLVWKGDWAMAWDDAKVQDLWRFFHFDGALLRHLAQLAQFPAFLRHCSRGQFSQIELATDPCDAPLALVSIGLSVGQIERISKTQRDGERDQGNLQMLAAWLVHYTSTLLGKEARAKWRLTCQCRRWRRWIPILRRS